MVADLSNQSNISSHYFFIDSRIPESESDAHPFLLWLMIFVFCSKVVTELYIQHVT